MEAVAKEVHRLDVSVLLTTICDGDLRGTRAPIRAKYRAGNWAVIPCYVRTDTGVKPRRGRRPKWADKWLVLHVPSGLEAFRTRTIGAAKWACDESSHLLPSPLPMPIDRGDRATRERVIEASYAIKREIRKRES